MNILLDECLPRQLRRELTGHTVATVVSMGWAGTKNGALLRRAEGQFDVFLTADQNLQYQQQLRSFQIAVIILRAPNTELETLRPLAPQILEALQTIRLGDVLIIEM